MMEAQGCSCEKLLVSLDRLLKSGGDSYTQKEKKETKKKRNKNSCRNASFGTFRVWQV